MGRLRGSKAVWAIAAVLASSQTIALGAAWEGGGAESAAQRAMLQAARTAFCQVHYFLKRPPDEPAAQEGRLPWEESGDGGSRYTDYINKKMSLLAGGLLLDNTGQVLVPDLHIEDKYVDRIEVIAPDGTAYPAEQDRILDRAPGVILQIKEPLKGWRAPRFTPQKRRVDISRTHCVALTPDGRDLWLTITPIAARAYDYRSKGTEAGLVLPPDESAHMAAPAWLFRLGLMGASTAGAAEMVSSPGLLCNDEGEPVGAFLSGSPMTPGQTVADWQHERLLRGPALTFAQLKELSDRCNEEFGKNVYKCRILFRHGGEGAGGEDIMSRIARLRAGMGGGEEGGAERTTFGLAVASDRLLVPQDISREEAAHIEKIEITTDAGTLEGEFIGAFKDVGAFLVGVKGAALPAVALIAPQDKPEKMRLFLTVTAREKFGKKHLEVHPNRWTGEERGYKDQYYISPASPCPTGSWVLNQDFTVLGLYGRQRIEGEELADTSDMYGMDRYMLSQMSGGEGRIFWSLEVAPMLADPVAHFDRQIRFKTEEEAKRLVWLGVEFTPMSKEVAKQLGLEKQTKGGSIGLSANLVYKGSPAERLGIAVGDVLLRIETPKRPHPIELSLSGGYDEYGSYDWTQYVDYSYAEEYGEAQPRWPLRLNYLTMLLMTIGEGETIKLTWLHEGEEVTRDYTIELAPPDFMSAKKYKNKEIGLTVKDMTYEVRTALRLPDDKAAVVVAKIEPGSPAEVARIEPFELIAAVDGLPVGSAQEFEERIKAALAAGRTKLRLTIEYLGKSRLADLDLAPPKEQLKPEAGEVKTEEE
jgi:hypothetical protein